MRGNRLRLGPHILTGNVQRAEVRHEADPVRHREGATDHDGTRDAERAGHAIDTRRPTASTTPDRAERDHEHRRHQQELRCAQIEKGIALEPPDDRHLQPHQRQRDPRARGPRNRTSITIPSTNSTMNTAGRHREEVRQEAEPVPYERTAPAPSEPAR